LPPLIEPISEISDFWVSLFYYKKVKPYLISPLSIPDLYNPLMNCDYDMYYDKSQHSDRIYQKVNYDQTK